MDSLEFDLPDFLPGWVWLTGAGPGDPGLLSLHALNGLRQADVVVYDALVNPIILDAAGKQAERVFAGKRGGRPSARQQDISERLISLARDGKRVLRLKGGDPFVFGRGGEEALALARAHVNFRIIPGITAGIGGLAYAGIPVTHRDLSAAVTFVTGRSADGGVPEDLDWGALARGSHVIVLYMALTQIDELSRRLRAAGRPDDEPVAIICRASLEDQKVIETTLGACAADARAFNAEPPAMVVVGKVVRLRKWLAWFERQPAP